MRTGNALRPSTASLDATVVNNLPGRYPTENWTARYWDVLPNGDLQERLVVVQLPAGMAEVCIPIPVGYNGCIQMVRRWGMACYPSLLEDIGFDPEPLLGAQAEGNGSALLRIILEVTHFDLPGHFIIASDEHPFRLYAPDGTLKGSYTRWCTYLGALAYLVSGGKVSAGFLRLWQDAPATYAEAVGYLQPVLKRAASAPGSLRTLASDN